MSAREQLKLLREEKGLSQAKFAQEIGFSQGYVNHIETGKAKPSRRILEAISKRYGVSIDWLLKGGDKEVKPEARFPGARDVLLVTYHGKNRDRIEELLGEADYTLFERLIFTNAALWYLDEAENNDRYLEMIVRFFLMMKSEPSYKDDALFLSVENILDDIPKLKNMAILAFAEGTEALFDYFYQFFSSLEYWDFDFDTSTLILKLFNKEELRRIPLLVSRPVLFSDKQMQIGSKVSHAVLETIRNFEETLSEEERKVLHEVLSSGLEILVKKAFDEHLKTGK